MTTTSSASALRPLRAIEALSFCGIKDPSAARISSGMIVENPFELVVEPHTVQLHLLLGERELLTFASFGDDPAALMSTALGLINSINSGGGDKDLIEFTSGHGLTILEHHRPQRAGQLAPDTSHPPLH